MSSSVPNVYTSVTLYPWQNRRKIIMHSCEQWFIFPGIGDYTTLCWDYTKPLKGSLFNRQKNGKYSKWFLLVAHISFAWRFDLGIWSIGLPRMFVQKHWWVRWFPVPGPEIHMIYLTLRWELRDDPMILLTSALDPFGGVQVQFNLMGFTTGRGTWRCKWLQRTWRDLYIFMCICIFRNNDNIGSWFKQTN